ncbi:MAG: hypothetical protein RBU45_15985 [Myxococcota bacterium]|nr:hypothetical protein [Myxococcota bacterium]
MDGRPASPRAGGIGLLVLALAGLTPGCASAPAPWEACDLPAREVLARKCPGGKPPSAFASFPHDFDGDGRDEIVYFYECLERIEEDYAEGDDIYRLAVLTCPAEGEPELLLKIEPDTMSEFAGGGEGAYREPGSKDLWLALATSSRSSASFVLSWSQPRHRLELLLDGKECTEAIPRDLDDDGTLELICEHHETGGMMAVPDVYAFDGKALVDRTAHFPALIQTRIWYYECAIHRGWFPHLAKDDLAELLRLAGRHEEAREAAQQPYDPGHSYPLPEGDTACWLRDCEPELLDWASWLGAAPLTGPGDRLARLEVPLTLCFLRQLANPWKDFWKSIQYRIMMYRYEHRSSREE